MGKTLPQGLCMETLYAWRPLAWAKLRGESQPTTPHPVWSAPRLDFEEQLEDLMGQHKDLWEFHVSHSQPLFTSFPIFLA